MNSELLKKIKRGNTLIFIFFFNPNIHQDTIHKSVGKIKLQNEAIVEGFNQMKDDLDAEKRSFQRIWKQREKQIEKVMINTVEMHGSIKGIAGNAIQSVKALELPGEDDEGEQLEFE